MSFVIVHPRALDLLDAMDRWGHVKVLQMDLDRAHQTEDSHPRRTAQLNALDRAFASTFDCAESLVQFHLETAGLRWPARSAWPDVSALAGQFVRHGRLDHDAPGEPPAGAVLDRLQRHVDEVWSHPRHGFAYVFQQETERGLWTSIPRWASDEREVGTGVNAGWIKGQSRWAVQIGGAGLAAPRFIGGLSRDGRALQAGAVASIIRATVVTTEVVVPHVDEDQGDGEDLTARRAMRHAA